MKNKKGFTLVELMVVITVISIMTGVSIIGLNSIRQRSQDTARLSGVRELQIALEAFKLSKGKYPSSASELVPGFLSKLPMDNGQTVYNSGKGFFYNVSTDRKSYCVEVVGTVFKPESQKDLQSDCENSWITCKGGNLNGLSSCGVGDGDTSLDNY